MYKNGVLGPEGHQYTDYWEYISTSRSEISVLRSEKYQTLLVRIFLITGEMAFYTSIR